MAFVFLSMLYLSLRSVHLILWDYDMGIYHAIQVHLAYGLPAGAVTYIDEEGDKISLDSEGE